MSSGTEFSTRTEAMRRELLAHCYQLLGSVHDAEDLVQETMVRAWRARESYDDRRASLRTWMYRIATNACLTALQSRARRPLPSGLGAPSDDPMGPLVRGEVAWLQPLPDTLLGAASDPAAVLAARGRLRLALVAALQYLPPRQRAVLILREVLDLPAAEVAQVLDTTVPAVNSALQRARSRLAEVGIGEDQLDEPADPAHRELVDRYLAAFVRADVGALTALVTDDAVMEMPPMLTWFVGRPAYGQFLERVFTMRGTDWRMRPTAANGQPALGAYARGADGAYHAHTLQIFTITGTAISRNTVYQDLTLFPRFDLPPTLSADGPPSP